MDCTSSDEVAATFRRSGSRVNQNPSGMQAKDTFFDVKIIAITDVRGRGVNETITAADCLAQSAVPGTVQFQLRDNELDWSQRLEFSVPLVRIARKHGQRVSVNDRLDLALSLGVSDVHLKTASLDVAAARTLFESRSVHGLVTRALHADDSASVEPATDSVSRSHEARPDAWLLSPVCQTRKGRAALGFAGLNRWVKRLPEPVFALGGVCAEDAATCLEAGAQGVAVIGAFYEEPLSLARALGVLRSA